MCQSPSLIRFELALAGDRRGDRAAGVVAKLDHHEAKRRIKPQIRIDYWQPWRRSLRPGRRLSDSFHFSNGIIAGVHDCDRLNGEFARHGQIDRKRSTVLAPRNAPILLCTG